MDKAIVRNIKFLRVMFILLIAPLIFQLFRIQVSQHDFWTAKTKARDEFQKVVFGERGNIYFSNGNPLAFNELKYGFYVLPDNFSDPSISLNNITKESFSRDVADILQLDQNNILGVLNNPKLKYAPLMHDISPELITKISDKYPSKLNIWQTEVEYKRTYPNNDLASKISGFVGKNDKGEDKGLYGIEGYFDGVLKGTDGIIDAKKDNLNQLIVNQNFDNIQSKNGIDLTLTINKDIQIMLEDRLMFWMDKFKSKEASAVIMEPNTGKIIALANYPTYNANEYYKGEDPICKYEYYVLFSKCNPPSTVTVIPTLTPSDTPSITPTPTPEDPRLAKFSSFVKPIIRDKTTTEYDIYRNSPNSYIYEPGSVVKPVTLAIGIDHNVIPNDPNYILGSHNGCVQVEGRTLCAPEKTPQSNLTLKGMIRYSDNVGALWVAQKMSPLDFGKSLQRFGLGRATGVELDDESVFKLKDINQWTKIDQSTAAFGQGSVSYTPIQLTNLWNILASGGKEYKPTIISKVSDNGKDKTITPVFIDQVVSQSAADSAVNITRLATKDIADTTKFDKSYQQFYSKYPYAGKTGTANVPKTDGVGYLDQVVNTSYIGMAPLPSPRFTMLVTFREPRLSNYRSITPDGLNTSQVAWQDIANRLVIQMNIPPVNQN